MAPKTHLSNETTSAKGRRVASTATIRNPTAGEPTRGGMGAGQNEGNMSWGIFLGFGFIPKCFTPFVLGDFQYLILKVVDIGHFNRVSCMVFAMLWHMLPAWG